MTSHTLVQQAQSITCGTASPMFSHDSEHQRFKQMSSAGETLYLADSGVLAERLACAPAGCRSAKSKVRKYLDTTDHRTSQPKSLPPTEAALITQTLPKGRNFH